MDVSPFPYQGPLEPDEFTGRDHLVGDLLERLTEHRVTAVLGPRRYGKTSLLRRVTSELADSGVAIVWVDFYEATSVADVAIRLDTAMADALHGPLGPNLGRLAASVSLNLGVLRVDLSRRQPARPDPLGQLHLLVDTLVDAARSTPTVLVFDEFPGIASVSGVAGLLRTALQMHYRDIALVFAGSQPSLMRQLFTDKVQPFYGQADLVTIGPLDATAVQSLVSEGFAGTGRNAGGAPGEIFSFAAGHPHRTMQLADAAWREVESGGTCSPTDWANALSAVQVATDDTFEAVYSRLGANEKTVLRLVATGEPLFGTRAQLLALSRSSAQAARASLLATGDIAPADESGYFIVDPLAADWVRRRFGR